MRNTILLVSLLAFGCEGPPRGLAPDPPLTGTRVAFTPVVEYSSGTLESWVIDISYVPDGSGAYFLGYRDGRIELRAPDHAVLSRSRIPVRQGNECGLLALEVDPRFDENRRIHIAYCAIEERTRVSRLDWLEPLPEMLPSESLVVTIELDRAGNDYHNFGDLGFDEHENLWVSVGDHNKRDASQNLERLEGSLVRVRPYPDATPGYEVPPDNPLLDQPDIRPEIVAYGVKSPFRVDYVEGGTWILGDVGVQSREEINVVHLWGPHNMGYNVCEGDLELVEYAPTGNPCPLGPADDYQPPALLYAHDDYEQPVIAEDPEAAGSAWVVVGGVLYDGGRYEGALDERYVYSDASQGFVRSALFENGTLTDDRPLGHLESVWVWKVAPDGFLYCVSQNTLYRLDLVPE